MSKIKNTFWFRHFLMCSQVANDMISLRGWDKQNFPNLIIESEKGRFGNDQMIVYFTTADTFFSDLHCSEEEAVFDYLEEEGVSMEALSKLSTKEIEDYYDEYCIGKIKFSDVQKP